MGSPKCISKSTMDGGDEQGGINKLYPTVSWWCIYKPNLPVHANDAIKVNKLCPRTYEPTNNRHKIKPTDFSAEIWPCVFAVKANAR